MYNQAAIDEYNHALRRGQREVRELTAAGRTPYPAVLDEITKQISADSVREIGLLEIPSERIVGTKSAGRITAFSASFCPLLPSDSEFAAKWKALCADHLSDTGIREPIECYEYLGNFYVQEGNKRVSVLRHFGAARIPATVRRVLPENDGSPRYQAYQEFLEFYRASRLYLVQFRRPGDYARLLKYLGKKSGEAWTEEERRTFGAYFHYFLDAFETIRHKVGDVLPEEALLLWLQVYPYGELGSLTDAALRKTLESLSGDLVTGGQDVQVQTVPQETGKAGLLTRLITPDHAHVAFVHQLDTAVSPWVLSHEEGRKHIEQVFGERITVRSYFDANTPQAAEALLQQAVSDGAQLVFTTAPTLSRATLKAAVAHPKVRFFNCSVDQPYASIRTYYGRIYEAKFITGAIAGAMAENDRIGYIAAYPIFGVPASINAFALGAQLTNPRARIDLRWSCCEGNPQADFLRSGIRVVSNREVPTQARHFLDFCNYGTYLHDDSGSLLQLGSPVWVWGKFYERAVQAFLSGSREEKASQNAVNYWLGMDSGVIDVKLSDSLPCGVRSLAQLLQQALRDGTLDPFARRIVSQDGTVRNDGTGILTPKELLYMDWLCENVEGSIPAFEHILPRSRDTVRELGIYRDRLQEDVL